MESDKLILLAQLIESLNNNVKELEKAFKNNDKEDYDISKKAILDFQSKINFLLEK